MEKQVTQVHNKCGYPYDEDKYPFMNKDGDKCRFLVKKNKRCKASKCSWQRRNQNLKIKKLTTEDVIGNRKPMARGTNPDSTLVLKDKINELIDIINK